MILHNKALPGITVTVSWTSGISSASSPSQLFSYTQAQSQTHKHTQTAQCRQWVSQNYRFNTLLKQQRMSLQGILGWCWQWSHHTLHYERNSTTAAAHYKDQIHCNTLPATKATACYCERKDTVWEKISVTGKQTNVWRNQVAFHVSRGLRRGCSSVSHLFQPLWVTCCPLVGVITLRVNTVNALCPLPIYHPPLLLTGSNTEETSAH